MQGRTAEEVLRRHGRIDRIARRVAPRAAPAPRRAARRAAHCIAPPAAQPRARSMMHRPRRSALYVPGTNDRALEKARTLPADCIIMDLEDAVPSQAKLAARTQVRDEVRRGGWGHREIIVRVNALSTEWGRGDVASLASGGVNALLLPKVESAEQVRELQRLLLQHGAPADVNVWCMIETPLGVLNVADICRAGVVTSSTVGCCRPNALVTLCMGFGDLGTELQAQQLPGRQAFVTSAQLCLLAARAHGLTILDGVYLNFAEDDATARGLEMECQQGVEWGMDGKQLIHPTQLRAANTAFAPDEAEVARSRKMVAVHLEALAHGKGAVSLDGRLLDRPIVAAAERILQIHDALATGGVALAHSKPAASPSGTAHCSREATRGSVVPKRRLGRLVDAIGVRTVTGKLCTAEYGGSSTSGGPFFDDLHVGQILDPAPAITIGPGEAATYQAICGDPLPTSLSTPLAEAVTGQSGALVNPALVLHVSIGQSTVASREAIANLFYRGVRLHRAVRVGDTLHSTVTIRGLRELRRRSDRPPRGLALLHIQTRDLGSGCTVAAYERCVMLRVRDPSASTGHHDDLGGPDPVVKVRSCMLCCPPARAYIYRIF
jgi:citrate lyase subunit beta/citryl-CoA lyase